ncbi:MAG: hypothetical protein MHPSP_003192 [Paramarteilia canceri]
MVLIKTNLALASQYQQLLNHSRNLSHSTVSKFIREKLGETEDIDSHNFDARVIKILKKPMLGAELRGLLSQIHHLDGLPEPETVEMVLQQCHRLNDLPLAIRFTESIWVLNHSKF